MPRQKKPTQLKVVAGTDRPDRQSLQGVDLPPVQSAPAPPDWLPNAHAQKEWKRLVPILMANKLLTDADLTSLGHLCALHGQLVNLHTAQVAPSASMISTLRTLQNDFGLTPMARGKVTPAEGGAKGNAFAGNGKRKKS